MTPIRSVPRRHATSVLLALLAIAALCRPPHAAASSSCVTLELFLYNLTGDQITANWVDESGNMVALPVGAQSVVYLGQPCINVSGGKAFPLSIEDPANGFVDAEYTINAENCLQENWLAAQSRVPLGCSGTSYPDSLSYYIESKRQTVCIQGPQGSPDKQSPNAAVGITSVKSSCPGWTPVFTVDFNDSGGDDPFDWPIALGTFTPTSGEGMSALPVLPGVSPSGVTPCVGTACIVPDDGDAYKFWPVTIFWYATPGGGAGFTFNGDSTFSLGGSYAGLNIPSQLSKFPAPEGDDIYLPPASTTIAGFPAPCWPTFEQNGALASCAPTANNVPAYVANPNAKSGLAQSILKISNDVVTALVDVITIGGVF